MFVSELSLSLARLRDLQLRILTSRSSRSSCRSNASVWKKRAHAGRNDMWYYFRIYGISHNTMNNLGVTVDKTDRTIRVCKLPHDTSLQTRNARVSFMPLEVVTASQCCAEAVPRD
jgi:hypothetical protein